MAEPEPDLRRHLTRPALQALQETRLQALWGELLPANAFYRRKWQAAGLADWTPSNLREFQARAPFTTKEELQEDQAAHPPYGTNLSFPLERYTRFHQTSSSRGAPLRWLDTPESWEAVLACWQRVWDAAEVDRRDRVFCAFSFGPFLGFWSAFEAALQRGCLCLPGGSLSSEARLRLMRENQVTVLCCTPTYALRLAEVARQGGFDLASIPLRRILVAGEPGGSQETTRGRIEAAFTGAAVLDHHGMTETGPVSYTHAARPGILRIIEAFYLAEILEPNGAQPVPRGQLGELVLTTLGRSACPLLRYRTGDMVREALDVATDADPDLALGGGILGRWDDMALVRGVNVYPSAVEAVIRELAGVAEFEAELDQRQPLAELRVRLEPEPALDADARAALGLKAEQRLREAFNLRVPVELLPPDALPRYELKARRWKVLR